MERVCLCYNCDKEFLSTEAIRFLCNDCTREAEKLKEDDPSKLKMYLDCQKLGIFMID